MEIKNDLVRYRQDDGSGDSTDQGHPFNGYDSEGNLWVFGKMAIVKNRKPRTTNAGSLSNVHTRKVTGDKRTEAGVGGSINTHHTGNMENRRTENEVIKKGE